ncbi:MAG: aspartate aminotransferase family protein [Akkermansiaceae bacterium]
MSYLLPTYGRFPLTLVKGEGARVWDDAGNSYLDFCAGIATCSLGHCHPALSGAIEKQAKTLMHCSNLYHIPQQELLAQKLVEDFVGRAGKVFFSNSGAEANDGMIKTARKFGHAVPNSDGEARYEVITFGSSFHGRTLGSMAATAQAKIHEGFSPLLPGFKYVPFNDVEALKAAVGKHTAAIMLEPIQGEGGVNAATREFLTTVAGLCEQHDLLLMLDEIQCGIGRAGTRMGWQSICPELQPDAVSFAKGLGGGFPIGAFYVSDRLVGDAPLSSLMGAGSHGSTYGGNPLACSAALAVLGEVTTHALWENAKKQGQRIKDTVMEWKKERKNSAVTEVRGEGLLLGFSLCAQSIQPEEGVTPALHLCKQLMAEGLLTVPAGPDTLRWLPPLNVSDEEVDEALQIMCSVVCG